MKDNIILIGMPACGKSTIAKLLQDVLTDYFLIDTDSLIEKTEGMKISDIFEKYSEDYFRKLEYDTIKMVCAHGEKKIISIGGGAFENPDSRMTLLNFGKVFYLNTSIEVLYNRIIEDTSRPLLQRENPREVLNSLMKKRDVNYNKAHYVIATDGMTNDEIVRYILNATNS